MNKKIIASLVAVFLSVFMLGGCDWFNSPSSENPPSTGDSSETPDPVLGSFDSYFNTTVAASFYRTRSSIADQNNVTYLFESIFDRQVEILTQDIIYRLVSVYGLGSADVNTISGLYAEDAFVYTDPLTGGDYQMGSNKATISDYYMVATPKTASVSSLIYQYADGTEVKTGAASVSTPNLEQTASYAYALKNGVWDSNTVLGTQLNFNNAINGGYTYNSGFTNTLNTAGKWAMSNSAALLSSADITNPLAVYQDYYLQNYATIKLALANILANGTPSGLTYEQARSFATDLGITTTQKNLIISYIFSNVIGSVNTDTAKKPGTTITASTALTATQHTYKAYAVVVPALVEQAVNNVFSGTTVSIWLTANNQENVTYNLSYNSLTSQNFSQIKITPSKEIPLTKLVFTVTGINLTNLAVTYSIYRSSTSALATNKTASKSGTKVTINMSNYSSYKIGTSGYITILIGNATQTPFSISFDGYYDS